MEIEHQNSTMAYRHSNDNSAKNPSNFEIRVLVFKENLDKKELIFNLLEIVAGELVFETIGKGTKTRALISV